MEGRIETLLRPEAMGDRIAYASLLKEVAPIVKRVLQSRMGFLSPADREDIVQDMLAHTMPGVMVVASMVAAIALLQAEGHYTYITL